MFEVFSAYWICIFSIFCQAFSATIASSTVSALPSFFLLLGLWRQKCLIFWLFHRSVRLCSCIFLQAIFFLLFSLYNFFFPISQFTASLPCPLLLSIFHDFKVSVILFSVLKFPFAFSFVLYFFVETFYFLFDSSMFVVPQWNIFIMAALKSLSCTLDLGVMSLGAT